MTPSTIRNLFRAFIANLPASRFSLHICDLYRSSFLGALRVSADQMKSAAEIKSSTNARRSRIRPSDNGSTFISIFISGAAVKKNTITSAIDATKSIGFTAIDSGGDCVLFNGGAADEDAD